MDIEEEEGNTDHEGTDPFDEIEDELHCLRE